MAILSKTKASWATRVLPSIATSRQMNRNGFEIMETAVLSRLKLQQKSNEFNP